MYTKFTCVIFEKYQSLSIKRLADEFMCIIYLYGLIGYVMDVWMALPRKGLPPMAAQFTPRNRLFFFSVLPAHPRFHILLLAKKHLSIFCAEGHALASLTRVNRAVASLVHSQKTHLFFTHFPKRDAPGGCKHFRPDVSSVCFYFHLSYKVGAKFTPVGCTLREKAVVV